MPEHVHLLLSEPERGDLAVVLQMLKQIVSQKLNERATISFWQSGTMTSMFGVNRN